MPLTTAQAMATFLADIITPTEKQQADVTAKRQSTGGYMAEAFPQTSDLPVKRVILIGSAARGTLIRPVDDVDVMAEFINKDHTFEKYRNDSGAFLQRIRTALDAKTAIKGIGARGQAVRLFYVNGAHVDIAPVFKWSRAGYALPSGDGGWITTDPEAQASWFTERKGTVGDALTGVIKLAKRWNAVHSKRMQLYHLEISISKTFSKAGSDYRAALAKYFEWAPNNLDVEDPAGHSGMLSAYLTRASREGLVNRFQEAAQRASRAVNAEAAGNHNEAKRLWSVELGDEFPTG